jgi:hypothetical protein
MNSALTLFKRVQSWSALSARACLVFSVPLGLHCPLIEQRMCRKEVSRIRFGIKDGNIRQDFAAVKFCASVGGRFPGTEYLPTANE